jgi:hypothetical protein
MSVSVSETAEALDAVRFIPPPLFCSSDEAQSLFAGMQDERKGLGFRVYGKQQNTCGILSFFYTFA